MSAVIKHTEERLMKVLLAPVISEKATFVAEKNEQVVFLVTQDATKLEIKAAVELLSRFRSSLCKWLTAQERSSAQAVSLVVATTRVARLCVSSLVRKSTSPRRLNNGTR